MYMKSFIVSYGEEAQVQCISSRPFLLHIHGSGRDGVTSVGNENGAGYAEHVVSEQNAHIVFGGNPADSVTIHTSAALVFNPNNFVRVLITMQTTEDAIAACSPS